MLNFEQFTALVKAGCNEEQIKIINNLFSPANANPPANPPADPNANPPANPNADPPASAPANAATSTAPRPADVNPNADPPADVNPKQEPPAESETVKMLKEMLGLMQKGAINNMQITQPKTQTAEQILASVLEP